MPSVQESVSDDSTDNSLEVGDTTEDSAAESVNLESIDLETIGLDNLDWDSLGNGESSDGASEFSMDVGSLEEELGSSSTGEQAETLSVAVDDESGDNEDYAAADGEPQDSESFDFSFDENLIDPSHDYSSSQAEVPNITDLLSAAGGKATAKNQEPLQLSEEEYESFLSILLHFPLNLRIAVEEYLSSDEGSSSRKMELIRSILAGASLRRTASTVSNYLNRTIYVPANFEKKTYEEYKLEKSSLKYVLAKRVLPLVSILGVVIIIAACAVFLSYHFIYRPLYADSLYKRGFMALQDEHYAQADDFFERAVSVWDKKSWYFAYARAYREKNQYIAAENIYIRLLDRWNNDLKGGLEYAEMLLFDLRNFERAETVLRRRVLDFHPSNLDAMLLLGDVFLEWAEEDPEKYEQARLQYATAIDLYGRKDSALLRMMRYFIRTDNLAEVLPLKEHFMNKRKKIGAADLFELGGYLLEKLYMPKADDPEHLIAAIADLRAILERGLAADSSIPEGHYNMGRFWIYNYAPATAAGFLNNAINLFASERQMPAKRILTYVDSFRLLGEIRASSMEYINAQELYASGISLYEDRKQLLSLPQDERIGKLYANYADIDYFITNDWDSALANYSKAASELYDTPSVRYRMGYIYYQGGDYGSALPQFVKSYDEDSGNSSLLFALGNTLSKRGSWNAARGYYERLMEISNTERALKGILSPQDRVDHSEFVEQYMHSANNLGVTLFNIAGQGGDTSLRGRAYSLFTESARAWDALTRNPDTAIRAEGSNLAYINMQSISAAANSVSPEIYTDIPKTLAGEGSLQSRVH